MLVRRCGLPGEFTDGGAFHHEIVLKTTDMFAQLRDDTEQVGVLGEKSFYLMVAVLIELTQPLLIPEFELRGTTGLEPPLQLAGFTLESFDPVLCVDQVRGAGRVKGAVACCWVSFLVQTCLARRWRGGQ